MTTPATALPTAQFQPATACDRYCDRPCYRYTTACDRPVYVPPHTPPSARARIPEHPASHTAALALRSCANPLEDHARTPDHRAIPPNRVRNVIGRTMP
jgi:hypothetical protein